MAEIHTALTHLSAIDWSDVPLDNLAPYLTEHFTAGELICNSIPQAPNGTPFEEAKPAHDEPNKATSSKDMHPSTTLSQPPAAEHADLSKHWGKPQKFKNNPLNVQVYKMAGNDRHGAWFARKSVHEGLGFDKMKRAMMREFPLSLSVKGGPGAGAVRGIAADKRLERKDVDGVGKLEVYQLSAQFPGPTTPREFVAMLMGSDGALSGKSSVKIEGGGEHAPRHYMLVSRPVTHEGAGERAGYVRGKYESVEMIREIPISTAKAKKTPVVQNGEEKGNGTDGKVDDDAAASDPELNPVEWIMVTRSDPGGGLPRFLVERGTPESIMSDVNKFFDWACSQGEILHPDEDLKDEEGSSEPPVEAVVDGESTLASRPKDSVPQEKTTTAPDRTTDPTASQEGGMFSNITSAIGAGIQNYAPASVAGLVQPKGQTLDDDLSSISDSSISSADSFLSADEGRAADDIDGLSRTSTDLELTKETSNNKELQKLIKQREKLNQQLAKKRIAEEAKMKQSMEKDSEEQAKYQEKMDKELKKTEEKHRKEVEKLEAKKVKELKKAEEKRAKKDDQTKINMLVRERDDFRSQMDSYRRENEILQAQVEELQSQNNVMAQRLGKDALKGLNLDGTGRERTNSMRSARSTASSGSGRKG